MSNTVNIETIPLQYWMSNTITGKIEPLPEHLCECGSPMIAMFHTWSLRAYWSCPLCHKEEERKHE